MSGFLFNIIIDWIMQNTNNARRGSRWKFTTVLEDLDYADNIALLSSRHKDLQEKCNRLHQVSRYTGTTKTKVLRTNTTEVANPRWTRRWRSQLLYLPRSHSPKRRWITWRHQTKAFNCKKGVCHPQSCLEIKDEQQAHQAENPQELCDLCSPVRRWDVEDIINRYRAARCFPPKMSKKNPRNILATHHL